MKSASDGRAGHEEAGRFRRGRLASFSVRFFAGLSISAFFIWLTLRGRDLSLVADGVREADYRFVLGCILVLLVAHVIRTLRWGLLVRPIGPVSFGHLNRASAVGFMALLLLPMRLGELGRPWMISGPDPGRGSCSHVPMTAALGTLVFERLFDGVLLTGTLFALLSLGGFESEAAMWLRGGAGVLFLAFSMGALLAWLAFLNRRAALSVLGRVSGVLGGRVKARALAAGERLITGLRGPRAFGGRAGFVVLSVGFWLVSAVAIMVLARAFDIEMTLLQALLVVGAQVVGVMIPAGPGMLGTFQYFTILGLAFFLPAEVLEGRGVAFANVLWACLFTQQVGLGLLLLPRRKRVLSRLATGEVEAAGTSAKEARGPGLEGGEPSEPDDIARAAREPKGARSVHER